MSNSSGLDWLNENEYRAYPLTSDSTRFIIKGENSYDLYQLILDALLVYPSIADDEIIEITQLTTTGTDLIISVTGTTFTIPNYISATYPYYVRDGNYNLLTIGCYANTLPINNTFYVSGTEFESSVVNEIPSTLGVNQLSISTTNLTGDITLLEGYQVSLIPNSNKTINIEVGRNEGEVLPCGDVLGLETDCNTVISSINGATPNKTGGIIKFIGQNHVVVLDDPNNNRIYIGFDFKLSDVPTQQLSNPTPLI